MAVSTAMPVVAADLSAIRSYGYAFSLFLTASLLGASVAGAWCDRAGPVWPMRVGLMLFGAGLLVCGVASSFSVLLGGRALAGAGGGLLGVSMYVVIADVYPSALQPRVFSLVSAGWVLPGIIGPVIAGWLAESVSWRLVFLLVPPLTVPAALALLPRLAPGPVVGREPTSPGGQDPAQNSPAGETARPGQRALYGAGLALGVVLAQWALGRVDDTPALGLVAVAGLVLAGLAYTRLAPAGTLRLARGLPTVVALRGFYAATFFGVESFIPLMLVTQRGLSATEAGLVLTGGAVGWTVGSFVQSRPGLRMPRHRLLAVGALVLAVSEAGMALVVHPWLPAVVALPIWAVTALGMGIGTATLSVLLLRLSSPGEEGRNSSALQLSDQTGAALGIGLTGAAFAAWHHPEGSDVTLFSAMFLVSAVVALAAAALAFRARAA